MSISAVTNFIGTQVNVLATTLNKSTKVVDTSLDIVLVSLIDARNEVLAESLEKTDLDRVKELQAYQAQLYS